MRAVALTFGAALILIEMPASHALQHQSITLPIRTVANPPDRYIDRKVTVTGRFSGRSADPDGPSMLKPLGRSRWDFILQADDAAIWISGRRPRGKDFDLDPESPADAKTGRWLRVTGFVRVNTPGGTCVPPSYCRQVWIEATEIELTDPPTEIVIAEPATVVEPPPQVVFNDPIEDEADVRRSTSVRIQFSRAMAAQTFATRIRATYVQRGDGVAPPPPVFSTKYDDATMSLHVRFLSPLHALQPVKVQLLEGITAPDGQPLAPWTLTFTTGAQ
jgi:hypothetical protein